METILLYVLCAGALVSRRQEYAYV